MSRAAERYISHKKTEVALATWRQSLRLPGDASVEVLGTETAIRQVVEWVKSSLRESIALALASPSSMSDGRVAFLWEGKNCPERFSAEGRHLELNHDIRIRDQYQLELRIPYIGEKATFELLSPEIRETLARPEPQGFFGKMWHLLAGPTMEVVHKETRGRPVTSPALLDLCQAIEDAGGVPHLEYQLDSTNTLFCWVSIKLDKR